MTRTGTKESPGSDSGKDRCAARAAVEIVAARTDRDYQTGRALIEEYAGYLGVDACLQGFSEEIANLRSLYGPPRGCLLLARVHGEAVGTVALRACADGNCELKRLYVKDTHRGRGIGRALTQEAVASARGLGYQAIVLETLETMKEARKLYASLGFAETGAYGPDPATGVRHMKLDFGISKADGAWRKDSRQSRTE